MVQSCSTCLRKRSAKSFLLTVLLFVCSGATCNHALRNPFASFGPPAPQVLVAGSSLDQVIAAVNQNSAKIQSLQTTNATITVRGLTGVPSLRGNIAAQRPGRLRLEASTTFLGPQVDLGSNDELFWFWSKQNEPPALYYSRHDQFAGSAAQQVMPIEPQWVLDALGMMQFSLAGQHQGPFPYGNNTLEIRSVVPSRSGTMTRTTVIDGRTAWVLEQHIYDAQGTLVASSRARSHRYYEGLGVSLPQVIDINIPATQLALTIDLGTVSVNGILSNPALWSLPSLSGYPQIDLGSAPIGSVSAMGRPGSTDMNTLAAPSFVGINSVPNQGTAIPTVYNPTITSGQVVAPAAQAVPQFGAEAILNAAPRQFTVELPTSQPRTQQLSPAGVPIR